MSMHYMSWYGKSVTGVENLGSITAPPVGKGYKGAQKFQWDGKPVKTGDRQLLIGSVVGLILVLVGIAVSCYFCATTSTTTMTQAGTAIQISNVPLCIIPAAFGVMLAGAMVVGVVYGLFYKYGPKWLEEEHSQPQSLYNAFTEHG